MSDVAETQITTIITVDFHIHVMLQIFIIQLSGMILGLRPVNENNAVSHWLGANLESALTIYLHNPINLWTDKIMDVHNLKQLYGSPRYNMHFLISLVSMLNQISAM